MKDSQIVEYGKRKIEHFSDADSASASGLQVDYNLQITALSKRQRKKYKTKLKSESNTTFKTRSTLVGLFEFMNSNPSQRQINDIEEIGFGSLLQLQNDKVPGGLALWLIENFNEGECSLMNGKLLIDEEDIHLVTGLPRGSLAITQKSNEKLRNKFYSQFEKGVGVLTTVLLEKIKSQKDGGKSFKMNFLIYVISSFLWGVKGAHPTLKFIDCLSDMSRIKEFNWCRFTLDGLLNGMRLWNSENKKIKYFTGPKMVLVFLYLDRVQFNASSGPTRSFPIMCTWSKTAIRERIKKELKISGSFGRGRVMERISNDNSALQIVEVKASEGECSKKKEEKIYQRRKKPRVAESSEKEKKIFFKKFSEGTLDFIKSYNNFSSVLKEANSKIPMCKPLRLANALMESFKKGEVEDNEVVEEVNEDEEDENVQMKENKHKGDEEENEKKESEDTKVKNSDDEEKIFNEMEVGEQKNISEREVGGKTGEMKKIFLDDPAENDTYWDDHPEFLERLEQALVHNEKKNKAKRKRKPRERRDSMSSMKLFKSDDSIRLTPSSQELTPHGTHYKDSDDQFFNAQMDVASDSKKMIFPTRIKAEEIDIMNESEAKDNETISKGPPDGSHEISSTTGFIWKTGVSSEDHLMDLSPTIQSRSNSSHCKNDHPHDAGLGSMNPYTSLLETINTKYGDITQGCNFTSDFFKERCLIAICEVVMKLQEFSANDYINSDVLAELSSTVKDAENMKLDVKWFNDCLVKIEESMRSRDELIIKKEEEEKELILQGANLQKSVKKNKLKIAELEHEIKMLEEKQAVKKQRLEVVKALTAEVKSASFPKYLMDGLL